MTDGTAEEIGGTPRPVTVRDLTILADADSIGSALGGVHGGHDLVSIGRFGRVQDTRRQSRPRARGFKYQSRSDVWLPGQSLQIGCTLGIAHGTGPSISPVML